MKAIVAVLALALATQFAQAEPAKQRSKSSVQVSRDAKHAHRRTPHIPHLILGIAY